MAAQPGTSGRFPATNARLLADVCLPATRYGETKNTACPTQQRLRYPFLVVGDRTVGDEIIYPEIDLEFKAGPDGRSGTSVSGRCSDREVCSPMRRHNRQCVELLKHRPRAWKRDGPRAKIKSPARGRLLNRKSCQTRSRRDGRGCDPTLSRAVLPKDAVICSAGAG